jgi:outer membrane protein assembly factor BamB
MRRIPLALRTFACITFALLICLPAVRTAAQDSDEEEEPAARRVRNCLHIVCLADLTEELKEVQKLISLKLWENVATAYTRILQTYSDKVVQKGEGRYLSLEAFLIEELKDLPEEGKRAFRIRSDLPAKRSFEKAKESLDTELLAEIVRRYPLSSFNDDCLSLLGDIALERGEFAKAASYYTRIPDNLGDSSAGNRILLLKTLAAVSGSNQTEKAEELLEKVKKFTDISSGWSKAKLSNFLENLSRGEETAACSESLFSPDMWQTVGGSNTRCRNSSASPRPGKKVWSASLFPDGNAGARFGFGGHAVVERKFDEFNYYPALAAGKLFLATESSLNVREIVSGRLRAHRASPGESVQFLAPDVIVAPVLANFSPDDGGLVFVNFITEVAPGEDFYGILAKASIPCRALFAIHPDSGKIAWSAPDDAAFKKAFANKRWSFGAPPLVVGTTVFAEVKVRSQIVTSYAVAFDALRGTMKWSVPLVSNGTELTYFGFDAREPLSTMITSSEDGETIFLCTSIGAVCALNASTGSVRWITEYSQIPLQGTRGFYTQPRTLSFANCPPIVTGNTLIAAPLDSRYVHAFDTLTGKIRWRVRYDDYDSNLKYVVGVFGENVILAGNQVVAIDLRSGKLRWKAPEAPALTLLGRPAIGGSLVYLPTPDEILLIDAKTGKLSSEDQPSARTEEYEPGNITIFSDGILTTSKDKITFYEAKSREP